MGDYQRNPRVVGTRGLIALARQHGLGLGLAGGFRILEPTTGNMGIMDSANVAARATGHGAYDKSAYKTGYSTIGAFDFEVTGEILPFLLRMMYGNAESRNLVNDIGLPGFEHLIQMDENEQFDSDYMVLVQSTGRSRGWRESSIYTRHVLRHVPTYSRLFTKADFNVEVQHVTNNPMPQISSLPITGTNAYSGGFVVENIGTSVQITAIAARQYDRLELDSYGFEAALWRTVPAVTTAPGPLIKAGRVASTKQITDSTYFSNDVPVDNDQVVAILDGQLKREFWRFPGANSPTVWPASQVSADNNAKSLALIYDYELVSATVSGDNSAVALSAAKVERIERIYSTNIPTANATTAPLAASNLYLIVPAANIESAGLTAALDKEWVKDAAGTGIIIKGGAKDAVAADLDQDTNKVLVVYRSVSMDVRTYNPFQASELTQGATAYECSAAITPLYKPLVFDPTPTDERAKLDLHVVFQYPWQANNQWQEVDLTSSALVGAQTIWERLSISRSATFRTLTLGDFDELRDGSSTTPGRTWIGLNTKILFDYQATQTSLYPQEIFPDCKPGRLSVMIQPGSSVRASVSIQGREAERLDSLDEPIGPRARDILLYPFEFERTSGFPLTAQTENSVLEIEFENGYTLGTTSSLDTGQSEGEIGSENLIIKQMSIECGNVLSDPEDRAVGLQVQPSIELLRRAASISAVVEMTSATYYDMLYYGLGRDRSAINDNRWNDDVLLGGMRLFVSNARPFSSVIGIEMPQSYFSGYIIERIPDRLVRAQIQITALRDPVSPSDTVKWRLQTPMAIEEAY